MKARMIKRAVEFIWTNHLYQYDNKVYRQLFEGAIGLRVTQVVARIVMNRWDKEFMDKMGQENNRWDLRMYKRYMDDANLIVKVRVQPGEGNNRIKEEANNIKELANSVMLETI